MSMTRRETLKRLGAVPALALAAEAAAAPRSSLVPIVTSGGTRLYPTWIWPQWWTSQPIQNLTWTLPQAPGSPPPQYVTGGYPSVGAASQPDGATILQDVRNTPWHGVFTSAYLQMVTRPLLGAQRLDGSVSLAVHCVEWHRRIDAVLALQVAVHRTDGTIRAMALPVWRDTHEFPLGTPVRTRAAVNWPLTGVNCDDGDVIAVNVGLWADNQTRTLAQTVGFHFYGNQAADITHIDSAEPGNTWVEFSASLTFRP